jgi:nickel-dependent lactate racemase
VNDLDRAWPRDLQAVLGDLWEVAGARATLVASTGSHRPDLAALVDRAGGLPVQLHDCDDAAAHGELPTEGHGAVRIDRRALRADLVLAFGTVEPHWFAGWSGAHKTASIGLLDRASITRNHRRTLEPGARPCHLEGNPVHEGAAAAVDALENNGTRVLAVNQVLDGQGRAVALGVGTWRGALERCLPAAAQAYVHALPAQVDLLVARVAGPLSRSLYQAEKGLKNSEHVVKDGGAIVIDAPLEQGVGQRRFVDLLARAPDEATARALVEAEGYVLGDHKAVRWRALEARGVRIVVASRGLEAGGVVSVRPTLEEALAFASEGRSLRTGLVVEDAALVVARTGGA